MFGSCKPWPRTDFGVFRTRDETSTPDEYLYRFLGVLNGAEAGSVELTEVDPSASEGAPDVGLERVGRRCGEVSTRVSTDLSSRRECARAERKCAGETEHAF